MAKGRIETSRIGLVLVGSLLLPTSLTAQGCGPTRLKVSESVVLDLPPAKVWQVIGDFQNMSWDPTVARTDGSGGNEADHAVRKVTLDGGVVFGESLYKYDADAMTYSYHVDTIDVVRLPVQNMSATLDVVAFESGARSKLTWRAAFYRYLKTGEPAPDVADALAAKAVSTYIRSGLNGLKAKLAPKT